MVLGDASDISWLSWTRGVRFLKKPKTDLRAEPEPEPEPEEEQEVLLLLLSGFLPLMVVQQ